MNNKSSAYYQRLYRQRLREQGLVKKEVWILPKHTNTLSRLEQQLRRDTLSNSLIQESNEMTSAPQTWTITSLYDALSEKKATTEKNLSIELLEGADPILHIIMHDYGDLPLFLAISGEQIIVEGTLWSQGEVKDIVAFNDTILRTHKLFPLSSIALENASEGHSYYTMYGALSASSSIESILLEIEVLADNIIKATEAYEDHLVESI